MTDQDVAITYETLFELLRIEKNREDLQKLEETFFEDVLEYLRQKRMAFESKPESHQTLFETDERERTRQEFENIKKILKDLYDRREKKIVLTAINKSRAGVALVNAANMLPIEKQMFDNLTGMLTEYRKNNLHKLVCGQLPAEKLKQILVDPICASTATAPLDDQKLSDNSELGETTVSNTHSKDIQEQNSEAISEPEKTSEVPSEPQESLSGEIGEVLVAKEQPNTLNEPKELKGTQNSIKNGEKQTNVKFLAPIEEIVGPDLQIYGPYDEGAEITLPNELAQVLVENNQAERL